MRPGPLSELTGDYAADLQSGALRYALGGPGRFGTGGIYVPAGGFPSYNASLQRAIQKNGISCIWDFGASIEAGGTACPDAINQRYPMLIRNRHFARYPWHGDTFLPSSSTAWNGAIQSSAFPFTLNVPANAQGWAATGTAYVAGVSPVPAQFAGPFFAPLWNTQTTMPLMTYTHPSAACQYFARAFSVYYWDFGNQDGGGSGTGRQFDIQLNGVVVASPTLAGDNKIHRVDILNAPNQANNALQFGNQRNAGVVTMAIIAVASYPTPTVPTFGVHWCHFDFAGSATIANLAATAGTSPAQRVVRYVGPSTNAWPFTPDPTFSPPFAPDFVIQGVFDDQVGGSFSLKTGTTPQFIATSWSPAMCLHGIRQFIQAWRQKPTGCDVCFTMPNMPNGISSDNQPGAVYQMQNAWMYYELIFRLSTFKGYGFADIDSVMGENAVANKYMLNGNPHPLPLGHQLIDHVYDFMGIG